MKLLYVKCNPRDEKDSACLTVGRQLLDAFVSKYPETQCEELDLYSAWVPMLRHALLSSQSALKSGEEYAALCENDRREIDTLNALCAQFVSADRLIIASPMWSLGNPPMLKAYLDAVIQNGKSIEISADKVHGLLGDKLRRGVFVRASGGKFPLMLSKLDYGWTYVKNIMSFLGYDEFVRFAVEGTCDAADTKACAIAKARKDIPDYVEDLA